MKSCTNPNCQEVNPQPLSNFSKNKKGRGGLYCHCRACQRKTGKLRYVGPQGRVKSRINSLRKYWPHLTGKECLQEYERLRLLQDNKCAICGKPETEIDKKYNKIKDLAVDHCHKAGAVRGLLCSSCNRGLGQLKDDPEVCLKAAAYLVKHKNG